MNKRLKTDPPKRLADRRRTEPPPGPLFTKEGIGDVAVPETLTADELAEILGITGRHVNRLADAESWPYLSAGHGTGRRFEVCCLPAEIQERILRYVHGVDEASVAEMAERFCLNVPERALKDPAAATKIRMVCECLAVPKHARGRNARIREIAESYGYHVSAVYKMIRRAKSGKPLIKTSKNYGISVAGVSGRLRAWDKAAADMAVGAIMTNKRAHREKLTVYCDIAAAAEAKGLRIGTYEAFCNLARRVDASVTTYRDKGVRGLREDIVPAISRDYTAYRATECLVGDQHKADYYAFDAAGNVVTLELFVWLDFRSQMAWGSIAYQHYNRYTVGQALLNAVAWGIPSTLYTDWGKPEESNYIDLLREQITGLGIRAEHIRHTHAKVRHPQAKPIEAWFGWLDRNLRNAGIPGYCKRLKDTRENELQQKELKELIRAGGLLRIEELVSRVFAVIDAWNEHNFKNRGGDTGKSPLLIYKEETAVHPVAALSADVLEYIFLPLTTSTVRRSQVKIRHEFLQKTITYYHPELSNLGGMDVTVRYNPFDVSHTWIFAAGKLVCCADEWGMINPKNQDAVMEKIEQQNSLVKQIKEKYAAMAPPAAPVRRLHAQEKEARQVRVMKTTLEEGRETMGEGRRAVAGYRPLMFNKTKEPQRLRPLFVLNMDKSGDDE